jgi:hypothetical protein
MSLSSDQTTPPRRRRSQKSPLWKYFQPGEKEFEVLCLLCQKSIDRSNGSTATMWSHLMHNHKEEHGLSKDEHSPNKRKRTSLDTPTHTTEKQKEQSKWDELIVNFVVYGFHPLTIVEEEHFLNLVNYATTHYKVPGRTALVDLIKQKGAIKKEQV